MKVSTLLATLLYVCSAHALFAQSSPGFANGQTLTGPSLNAAFENKQDYAAQLTWSGSPTISAVFGGQTQLNSFYFNGTAASATLPESIGFLQMTSATGAASGNGGVSAYKMGLALQVWANPGTSNIYGLNIVENIASGVGAFQASGVELDFNNLNHDYPESGYAGTPGNAYAQGILLDTQSNFQMTAAIILSVANSTPGFHDGTWYNGNVYSDYGTHDNNSLSTTKASYLDQGAHSVASFQSAAVTPVAFLASGTNATASFQGPGFTIDPTGNGVMLTLTLTTPLTGTPTAYACFDASNHVVKSVSPC
jgi:hypothetical protein